MANHGAQLQGYNNELVKCLEELRNKKEIVRRQIQKEEEEKSKIQNDIRILQQRLDTIDESLTKKYTTKNDYERTITETEQAYLKILESSSALLQVLRKESSSLIKHVNEV